MRFDFMLLVLASTLCAFVIFAQPKPGSSAAPILQYSSRTVHKTRWAHKTSKKEHNVSWIAKCPPKELLGFAYRFAFYQFNPSSMSKGDKNGDSRGCTLEFPRGLRRLDQRRILTARSHKRATGRSLRRAESKEIGSLRTKNKRAVTFTTTFREYTLGSPSIPSFLALFRLCLHLKRAYQISLET